MNRIKNHMYRLFFALVALVAGSQSNTVLAQPADHAGHAHHAAHAAKDQQAAPVVKMVDGVQVVEISVSGKGFAPGRIELKANVPARLVFTRTEKAGCADKVQIPAFGIKNTDLPLGKAVAVEFTPKQGGEFAFACGMNMVKGALLVKS